MLKKKKIVKQNWRLTLLEHSPWFFHWRCCSWVCIDLFEIVFCFLSWFGIINWNLNFLVRWHLALQEQDFDVMLEHNQIADAMSQLCVKDKSATLRPSLLSAIKEHWGLYGLNRYLHICWSIHYISDSINCIYQLIDTFSYYYMSSRAAVACVMWMQILF